MADRHCDRRGAGRHQYIAVAASIPSRSAGPTTRANLDQHIATTEWTPIEFSRARQAEAIRIPEPGLAADRHAEHLDAKVSNPDQPRARSRK